MKQKMQLSEADESSSGSELSFHSFSDSDNSLSDNEVFFKKKKIFILIFLFKSIDYFLRKRVKPSRDIRKTLRKRIKKNDAKNETKIKVILLK